SEPGAKAQNLHVVADWDDRATTRSNRNNHGKIVTTFSALHDISDYALGPTVFEPKTHVPQCFPPKHEWQRPPEGILANSLAVQERSLTCEEAATSEKDVAALHRKNFDHRGAPPSATVSSVSRRNAEGELSWEKEAVWFPLAAGDCVTMYATTWHSGGENTTTDRRRVVLSIHFYFMVLEGSRTSTHEEYMGRAEQSGIRTQYGACRISDD
ncbi:unnamed protein product, partial [Amoebophrya sp. A25]